ncbi:MAG: hypothetical protein PHR94_13360 [Methylomonas lenta]|nr:hypothetical protein [Methylomonas lenta]
MPDCLPLYEIAILSNINPDAFRRVIERSTGIELVEQEFEYRGWKTGKKYRDKGITKAAYKSYLQSLGRWPVDGLLADWWINEQSNATTQPAKGPEKNTTERELTTWLRETWIKEGMPEGTAFFNRLKKYVNQKGSPIIEHWTADKNGGGFRWNTGTATGSRKKKRIQSMVSEFKKDRQKNTVKDK